MPPEAQSIREFTPKHIPNEELGAAVQRIVQAEGVQPLYTQYRSDSSSQYLPDFTLDKAEIVKLKKEKALVEGSDEKSFAPPKPLEGGVRGLVVRTDADANNSLSREEILSRLRMDNLPPGDGAALKTLLANFKSFDGNHDGGISRTEINTREFTDQTDRQNMDRLSTFTRIVQTRRAMLDRNSDGRITESELGAASRDTTNFTRQERRTLDWAHDRWD